MNAPELLSPAGSLKAMRMAFAYGADAVYAGQPRFSLRVRNNEFDLDTLAIGIKEAHQQGKKFYLVVNIAPHNSKLQRFVEDMAPAIALKPDALIVSDPGVVFLLRQHFPQMSLHLSVQANTVNWAAVLFWQQQGIERVILSRELALEEIAQIREKVPQMELEVFVHGALCMAYSGRCLLSGYINKRDPNQGACTNACRWSYQSHGAEADEVGQYRPVYSELPEPVLVEEQGRPGELMLLDEDEHGSYIFNSKDLRAVQHVPALTAMGVHSLKIEGRTKSPYYVARTAQVYRKAIDDTMAGKGFDLDLLQQLNGMANRGFTEGFLRRHVPTDLQNYQTSHSEGEQLLVGEFSGELNAQGQAMLQVKNRFSFDDRLQLMTPQGITEIDSVFYAADGQQLLVAPSSGYQVWFQLPAGVSPHYGFLLKQQKVQAKASCGETLCQCG